MEINRMARLAKNTFKIVYIRLLKTEHFVDYEIWISVIFLFNFVCFV